MRHLRDVKRCVMSEQGVTRRHFLGGVAAIAAPALLPGSLAAAPDRFRKVDESWAEYFGCSTQDLSRAGTLVVPHKALVGYDGVLVFRHAAACIISVPDSVPEIERSKLRAAGPAEVFDPGFLAKVFLVRPESVRGPLWIGIADQDSFKPVQSGARLLGDADEPALMRLAEGCGELGWSRSRMKRQPKPIFGLFQGKDLVAVSGYLVIGNGFASIGMLTHPAQRGKGYRKAVASAAAADAISKGYVALCRTLESEKERVALARSMGFHPYASALDVWLAEDEF